jgi:hypothetical protein
VDAAAAIVESILRLSQDCDGNDQSGEREEEWALLQAEWEEEEEEEEEVVMVLCWEESLIFPSISTEDRFECFSRLRCAGL